MLHMVVMTHNRQAPSHRKVPGHVAYLFVDAANSHVITQMLALRHKFNG